MKKLLYIFPLIAAALMPVLVFAQTATDTISLPSNFTSDILTQATALLGSLEPYITLILGVLLALVVVEFVISAIRHRGQ
jgi:hypothetical protein